MPTTKKTKVATETTPIADETAQESPEIREQSRASGQAMFDNACREGVVLRKLSPAAK